ncbi:MAG: sugar phosphate nucleotidyltransferase, partial [candidate division WOR-3 bacterium]
MMYTVIMAGGKGTRLWPVSTKKEPKQFMPIVGDEPLISQTRDRVKPLTPIERIKVITTQELKDTIKELGFLEKNIWVEPRGMNTLYAIALSAAKLMAEDVNALMLTLPSDHWISDNNDFIETIEKGIKWAERGYLVTYGIIPTRPETGYGYIERGDKLEDSVMKAKRFTEKPKIKTANDYLKSKNFLWNSGIFLWRADDDNGNIHKGNVIEINCHDNIFYSENGIIVAKDLSKMVVIHAKGATLIIPKADTQELKEIVEQLPKKYKSLGFLEPVAIEDFGTKKVRLYKYVGEWRTLNNFLVMCLFPPWSVIQKVDIVRSVTGWNTTAFELMKVVERGNTLTRIFNNREGFTEKDDWLPPRFFQPKTSGALSKTSVNPRKLQNAK